MKADNTELNKEPNQHLIAKRWFNGLQHGEQLRLLSKYKKPIYDKVYMHSDYYVSYANALNIYQSETSQSATPEKWDTPTTSVDKAKESLSAMKEWLDSVDDTKPNCLCDRDDLKQRPHCVIHDGPNPDFGQLKSKATLQPSTPESVEQAADKGKEHCNNCKDWENCESCNSIAYFENSKKNKNIEAYRRKLELASENFFENGNYVNSGVKIGFIAGAKWQSEQSPSTCKETVWRSADL